jgi:hypothetical protein
MERSEMREQRLTLRHGRFPDFAALHPGYEPEDER